MFTFWDPFTQSALAKESSFRSKMDRARNNWLNFVILIDDEFLGHFNWVDETFLHLSTKLNKVFSSPFKLFWVEFFLNSSWILRESQIELWKIYSINKFGQGQVNKYQRKQSPDVVHVLITLCYHTWLVIQPHVIIKIPNREISTQSSHLSSENHAVRIHSYVCLLTVKLTWILINQSIDKTRETAS